MSNQDGYLFMADPIRRHAVERADATALIFEGHEISYGELDQRTNKVANGLIAAGVRPGERVAILAKNIDLFFEIYYGASKAGIMQLTQSLAGAWAEDGIRVNALAPGWITSRMTAPVQGNEGLNATIIGRTPLGRWGVPDEVAGGALFLASVCRMLLPLSRRTNFRFTFPTGLSACNWKRMRRASAESRSAFRDGELAETRTAASFFAAQRIALMAKER